MEIATTNNSSTVQVPEGTFRYLFNKSQDKVGFPVAIPDTSSPTLVSEIMTLSVLQSLAMKWEGAELTGSSNDIFIAFCGMIIAQIRRTDDGIYVFHYSREREFRIGFASIMSRLGSILTTPSHHTAEMLEVGTSLKRLANEVAGVKICYVGT